MELNNREFSQQDDHFRKCCKEAGTEPTTRQASKFRKKRGKAYQFKNKVVNNG